MNQVKITTFKDGVEARLINRRISLKGGDDGYIVAMEVVLDDPSKPVHFSELVKGKLSRFAFGATHQTMEALVVAYLKYRESVEDPFDFTIMEHE